MSVYAIYFSPTRGTEKIRQKLHTAETYEKLALSGSKPYRTYQGVPLKPKADKHCTACGLCARVCQLVQFPVTIQRRRINPNVFPVCAASRSALRRQEI